MVSGISQTSIEIRDSQEEAPCFLVVHLDPLSCCCLSRVCVSVMCSHSSLFLWSRVVRGGNQTVRVWILAALPAKLWGLVMSLSLPIYELGMVDVPAVWGCCCIQVSTV